MKRNLFFLLAFMVMFAGYSQAQSAAPPKTAEATAKAEKQKEDKLKEKAAKLGVSESQVKLLQDEKARIKQQKEKLKQLKQQNLPTDKERDQREKLKEERTAKVQTMLGDANYAKWKKDKQNRSDAEFKKEFGVTDAQVKQYKDLMNAKALDIEKAKHIKLPKADKKANIKSIKKSYSEKLQTVFTQDQYKKFMAKKAKKQ